MSRLNWTVVVLVLWVELVFAVYILIQFMNATANTPTIWELMDRCQ